MITTSPQSTGAPPHPGPDAGGRAVPGSPGVGQRPVGGVPAGMWLLVVALLLAVVAAAFVAVTYLTGSVRIDLVVDGETTSIETRSDTVGDLLAEADIAVGDGDVVVPPPDTELAEDDVIEVRFARPLTVVVDGVEQVHTTAALTVGEALDEIGAPMDGSDLSVPLGEALPRSGSMVEIVTPKSVTVVVGGDTTTVTGTALTVGDVLDAEGIVLAETDRLDPVATTTITDAMTITVTRIRIETEVRTEAIAHDSVERDDPDRTVGTRAVVTEGVDGSQDVTYSLTYTNDELTSEEIVSTEVTSEPVTEVVAVGTRPAPTPAPAPAAPADSPAPSGGSGGLNWAALADCESSGNPRAVNPAGYYGLYQFSLPTWASVGGSGNPVDASPEEQTMRAQILYERSGAGQWPHCGPRLFQ